MMKAQFIDIRHDGNEDNSCRKQPQFPTISAVPKLEGGQNCLMRCARTFIAHFSVTIVVLVTAGCDRPPDSLDSSTRNADHSDESFVEVTPHDRNADGEPESLLTKEYVKGQLTHKTIIEVDPASGKTNYFEYSCFSDGLPVYRRVLFPEYKMSMEVYLRNGKRVLAKYDNNFDGEFDFVVIFDSTGSFETTFVVDTNGLPRVQIDGISTQIKENYDDIRTMMEDK